jgi:hypothetical protein
LTVVHSSVDHVAQEDPDPLITVSYSRFRPGKVKSMFGFQNKLNVAKIFFLTLLLTVAE